MAGGGGGVDDNTAQAGHLVAVSNALTSHHARNDPNEGGLTGVDLAQIISGENRSDPQPTLSRTGQPALCQGTDVGPMGTLRSGNGNETGGVPFTLTGDRTHALTAEGADASEDGTGRGTPVVAFGHTNGIDPQASETVTPTPRAGHDVGGGSIASASAVRRLTPVECERLQGLPDSWTARRAEVERVGNRWKATGKAVPQADSQRYRQLGNSIAVPVFTWVADGITGYELDND